MAKFGSRLMASWKKGREAAKSTFASHAAGRGCKLAGPPVTAW